MKSDEDEKGEGEEVKKMSSNILKQLFFIDDGIMLK